MVVADSADPFEALYARGVTDGLPVVPPTRERVAAAVAASGRPADTLIARVPPNFGRATVEKIAINAVMAGCRPEYMPVVVAAIEGIADPRWGYHGPATSTGSAAVLTIVNGPIARRLDFNSGDNLFSPGWRANATVGRAVRLVMRNVIGTIPGRLDRGTFGHPGRYTYVMAENEAESPWTPLHVERAGCRPTDSAVTVMAALAPIQFYNQLSSTAAGVLGTLCDTMRYPGQIGQPNYCVVLAGEHMRTIAADGWSKADIRKFIFENSTNTVAHFKRTARMPGAVKPEDETATRPLVQSPDDILVVAAGGRAGSFSCFIPGWASRTSSEAVTVVIKERSA
jgi:hypothetical protein